MLLLGLLLLIATGAFTGLVIADNLSGGPETSVSVLGNHLVTLDSLAVFSSGLALALLFCLGLAVATRGTTHRHHGSGRHAPNRVAQASHEPEREPAGLDTRH